MQVREYLGVLDRRKWIIIIVTALTVTAVTLLTRAMTPIYSASALVRIARVPDPSGYYTALNYVDRVIMTYVTLLPGPTYLGEVIDRLGLETSPGRLSGSVRVESLPNTELLRITTENPDPRVARDVANTLAAILVEEGQRIYTGPGLNTRESLQESLQTQQDALAANRSRLQAMLDEGAAADSDAIQELRALIDTQEQQYMLLLNEYNNARLRELLLGSSISVAEEATLPSSPSRPRVTLNIALSVLVGLGGGTVLAFLVDNLNRHIHNSESLEAAGRVPVLGSIPTFPVPRGARGDVVLLADAEPLLGSGEAPNPAGEAFRMLRSVILSGGQGAYARPRSLLITSSAPAEGKSTLVANLAQVMAQTGRQVIVVDSDLRRPTMHRVFGLPNDVGLSTLILGRGQHTDALQNTRVPGIRVLTSGPLPRYPAELLSSSAMQQLIADLVSRADIVLFDTPPILAASDGVGLAAMVDGVLLVAARDEATDRQVQRALQQLERVGARVLGTVLNRAKAEDASYTYYYDPAPAGVRRSARVRR